MDSMRPFGILVARLSVKLQNRTAFFAQEIAEPGVSVVVAILQPLKNNKPIPIDRAVILVGRGEDCDVVINGSKKISRKHCCLVQSDESFFIRDLGSTNGVWVNGKRVDRESEMLHGDRVAIGDVKFRFYPDGANRAGIEIEPEAARPKSKLAGSGVEILGLPTPPESEVLGEAIEIVDDDLLDDGLIEDDDMDLIDDLEVAEVEVISDGPRHTPPPSTPPPPPATPQTPPSTPTPTGASSETPAEVSSAPLDDPSPSTGKGRPFQGEIESEPVINLDESFADSDIDDIVDFDD